MKRKHAKNNNIFFTITNTPLFQKTIIGVILLAAVLVGFETYPDLHKKYLSFFKVADVILQGIFTIEIIMRILAYGKKPWTFFKSGANNFDFIITAFFYLPFGGSYASILRLVRIFRVLRLITAVPRLQVIVGALIKSVPSMGYISLLMLIQVYIFAVLGNFLFGQNDPEHFGNLGVSMLTLFQIITLEGWIEVMKLQPDTLVTPLYFITFILLGTMIVLNLFIGVILSGFEEVKEEIEQELTKRNRKNSVKDELRQISNDLKLLKAKIDSLSGIKKEK